MDLSGSEKIYKLFKNHSSLLCFAHTITFRYLAEFWSNSQIFPLLIMAQFQKLHSDSFRSLMASSEVDQKFLGRHAKALNESSPFLSAMLFKILGLSVQLSKKLVRARRLRRLDTTRDTKSLQLYHHIIWLAREGLTILEEYVLSMVEKASDELRVLSFKLRASFYHIFVLFHNQPSVYQTAIPSFSPPQPSTAQQGLESTSSGGDRGKSSGRDSTRVTPSKPSPLPPGLAPVSVPKPSASFLLPAQNYIPLASSCFAFAAALADRFLQGSHPLRLSVKIEYAAYLYDCLHDGAASRKLADSAIQDLYNATEHVDDEMFEDAAQMLVVLGRMKKRGLGKAQRSGDGSAGPTPGSTPRFSNGDGFSQSAGSNGGSAISYR